jgi:hypothetical protein
VGSTLGARITELVHAGIDPQEVACRVLDAVRNDELYAFTHPEMRRFLAERFSTILAAYDKLPEVPR